MPEPEVRLLDYRSGQRVTILPDILGTVESVSIGGDTLSALYTVVWMHQGDKKYGVFHPACLKSREDNPRPLAIGFANVQPRHDR